MTTTTTQPTAAAPAYVIETRTSQTPWNRDADLGPYASTEAAEAIIRIARRSGSSKGYRVVPR